MAYYALKKDVFDINKVTVVGSPTITSDGVASGFSKENKINSYVVLTNNFEISFETKLGESLSSDQGYFFQIYNGSTNFFDIRRYQKHINFVYRNTNNSYGLGYQWVNKAEANKTYKFKIVRNGNNIAFYADDVLLGTKADAFTIDNSTYSISFGNSANNQYPLTGSIDLKSFKIYVDNKLVYTPTKPAYLLERRKPKVWDKEQFTVVGSPVISESGVLTNCPTQNDYLMKEIPSLSQFGEVEIRFSFKVNSIPTSSRGIFNIPNDGNVLTANNGSYAWLAANGYFGINLAYNNPITSGDNGTATTGSYKLEIGDTVKVIAKAKKGEVGNFQISKNNASFEEPSYVTTRPCNFLEATKLYIGITGTNRQMQNYMDIYLTDFAIWGDGEKVFDGGKERYLYDSSKFTVVGSPTISESGVASGFSGSDYLRVSGLNFATNNFKANFKIKMPTDNLSNLNVISFVNTNSNTDFYIDITGSGNLLLRYYKGNSSFNNQGLATPAIFAKEYNIKISIKGGNITIICNNNSFNVTDFVARANIAEIRIGNGFTGGSIDLPSFSITVDGKEVLSGAKEVYYAMEK